MPTAIERVKAFRDALASVGATEHRMPLTTPEALALANECNPATLRHPDKVSAAMASMAELNKQPMPDGSDESALREYLNARERARSDFWDGFEGHIVEGVEIVRRGKL